MLTNKRLILAHFWLAFDAFGGALVLGAWQMFVRSPLNAWHFNPEFYYRSVTAHGSVMGYVFPTLIAMGFGYAISESALEQRLVGVRWAWTGFWLIVAGSIMALLEATRFLKDAVAMIDGTQLAALRLGLIGVGIILLLILRPQGLLPEPQRRSSDFFPDHEEAS